MKKRLTTLAVTGLLLLATSAHAYDVTGRLTNWYDMKKSGWTSADGYDDVKMLNALGLKADIIGYYPWTNTFLLRQAYNTSLYLADKKAKTVRYLNLKTASGYASDLDVVYQGEDNGKGCYFSIVDTQVQREMVNKKAEPRVLMVLPENCTNKQQLAAIKARQTEKDRQLQQWASQQSLKELCRRTGNC